MVLLPELAEGPDDLGHVGVPFLGLLACRLSPSQRGLGGLLPIRGGRPAQASEPLHHRASTSESSSSPIRGNACKACADVRDSSNSSWVWALSDVRAASDTVWASLQVSRSFNRSSYVFRGTRRPVRTMRTTRARRATAPPWATSMPISSAATGHLLCVCARARQGQRGS